MKTFKANGAVTPWGAQLKPATCDICGADADKSCCLLDHAAHSSPETKIWGINCVCKKCRSSFAD